MPVMKVGPGRALVGGGGTYNDLVMGTQPIAYWPQSETAGVTAHCLVNPLQDGTYTGVTLANDNTGPFGTPAPFYDGANDYCNVQTATYAAAFNGAEGSAMVWAKMNAVGLWTDGLMRVAFLSAFVNTNNRNWISKSVLDNQIQNFLRSSGTYSLINNAGHAETIWLCLLHTWSEVADEHKAYVNGVQDGLTVNGLGVWAGVTTISIIGAYTLVPASVWHGWLGPTAAWDRPLMPAEVASLYVS